MNTGSRNNEELVKLYKESRDEAYLAELISQNTGLINLSLIHISEPTRPY